MKHLFRKIQYICLSAILAANICLAQADVSVTPLIKNDRQEASELCAMPADADILKIQNYGHVKDEKITNSLRRKPAFLHILVGGETATGHSNTNLHKEFFKTDCPEKIEAGCREWLNLLSSDADHKNPKKKSMWVVGWENHRPFLRRSEGGFEAFVSGYMQLDSHGYGAHSPEQKIFSFRRVRLGIDGKFHRNLDFKVQADFSDLKRISLRDAYLKFRVRDEFQLWFGQMSGALHLQTVAEGIEEPEQRAVLKKMGCELGQGYYFAKPLDEKAMDEFLQQENSSDVESNRQIISTPRSLIAEQLNN